jgi:NDP-sugar pyrophosphorylase family protein
MKAMIFAAGLGTRLQPLTNNKPKALVEVNGVPILEKTINHLIDFGVNDIIINVHHFAEKIIEFLKKNDNFGIKISISDETQMLLETGGGLKKAKWFFNNNKPFFVVNGDVISNINLNDLYEFHLKTKAFATLAVRKRETQRYFLFNQQNKLCGWQNTKTNEIIKTQPDENLNALAFSGIQVISPEIFNFLTQDGAFSITNTYLELSKKHTISGFQHDSDYWFDLGTIEKLKIAEKYLQDN